MASMRSNAPLQVRPQLRQPRHALSLFVTTSRPHDLTTLSSPRQPTLGAVPAMREGTVRERSAANPTTPAHPAGAYTSQPPKDVDAASLAARGLEHGLPLAAGSSAHGAAASVAHPGTHVNVPHGLSGAGDRNALASGLGVDSAGGHALSDVRACRLRDPHWKVPESVLYAGALALRLHMQPLVLRFRTQAAGYIINNKAARDRPRFACRNGPLAAAGGKPPLRRPRAAAARPAQRAPGPPPRYACRTPPRPHRPCRSVARSLSLPGRGAWQATVWTCGPRR
jgi:hypothetical protein